MLGKLRQRPIPLMAASATLEGQCVVPARSSLRRRSWFAGHSMPRVRLIPHLSPPSCLDFGGHLCEASQIGVLLCGLVKGII